MEILTAAVDQAVLLVATNVVTLAKESAATLVTLVVAKNITIIITNTINVKNSAAHAIQLSNAAVIDVISVVNKINALSLTGSANNNY